MTLVVPNVGEVKALELFLERPLTLKLFSNDITPAEGTTLGSLTEVAGGGYEEKVLDEAEWTITAGAPSSGIYNAAQNFSFTGTTDAPGTIYGYYVVDDDGILCWIERFEESVVPFTPGVGSLIRVTPRFQAS